MITYYVAASLDGYIATPDGGLEWLEMAGKGGEGGDYGYASFLKTVGVMVMGRKTYDICLGFPEWPYPGREVWVLSHQDVLKPKHGERFANFNAEQWRDTSKSDHVWLIGGGETAKLFLEHGLVGRIILTTLPVLLGKGLPLFAPGFPGSLWKLESCESHPSGLIQSTYSIKN